MSTPAIVLSTGRFVAALTKRRLCRGIALLVIIAVLLAGAPQRFEPAPVAVGKPFEAATGPPEEPRWVLGDWWDVVITDPDDAAQATVRLVAVEETPGSFSFWPTGKQPRILFAPLVPLGAVQASPFSFQVDDVWFEALRFPATAGSTWTTRLGQADVAATILDRHDSKAHIQYVVTQDGEAVLLNATYDFSARFFASVEQPNGMRVDLVDWGNGRDCVVWKPGAIHRFQAQPFAMYRGIGHWEFEVPFHAEGLYLRLGLRTTGAGWYGLEVESPVGMQSNPPIFSAPGRTYQVEQGPLEPSDTRFAYFFHDDAVHGGTHGTWLVRTRATDSPMTGYATHWAGAVSYRAERIERVACQDRPLAAAVAQAPEAGADDQVLIWIVTGSAAVLWLAWTGRGLFWWLLAKVTRENALDHDARRRLVDAIRKDPGITTQELSTTLEIPWATVNHHLRILVETRHVIEEPSGRSRHWFDASHAFLARERAATAILRRPAARRIYAFVREHPGLGPSQIARDLNVQHTTVRFHLKRLELAELVHRVPRGRRFQYMPGSGEPRRGP